LSAANGKQAVGKPPKVAAHKVIPLLETNRSGAWPREIAPATRHKTSVQRY